MRKTSRAWILLGILAFLAFGTMRARADVSTTATLWLSSYTATNDPGNRIACNTVPNGGGCKLHSIVVASTGSYSTLTIYNSSSTAVNTFTTIRTDLQGPYVFDVYLSSGLFYSTAGTIPAKLNILYAKPTIR